MQRKRCIAHRADVPAGGAAVLFRSLHERGCFALGQGFLAIGAITLPGDSVPRPARSEAARAFRRGGYAFRRGDSQALHSALRAATPVRGLEFSFEGNLASLVSARTIARHDPIWTAQTEKRPATQETST